MKKSQLKVGLLEKIKGHLTKNGKKKSISDRSIKELLDSKLKRFLKKYEDKKEDDDIDEKEFLDAYLDDFVVSDSNIRNDIAEGIKESKKDNNKSPKDDNNKPLKGDDALAQRIDALEKQSKEREEYIKGIEKKTKTEAKKQQIIDELKTSKIEDKEFLDFFFDDREISEDTDVDAQVVKAVNAYNRFKASPPTKVETPDKSTDDDNSSISDEDYIKRVKGYI